MRLLLALVAASLLAACSGCHAPPSIAYTPAIGDREFIESLLDRTLLIRAKCEDGSGSGSAVILGPYQGGQLIATAAHVVDGTLCTYTAGITKAGAARAELLAVDKEHDVALLWRDALALEAPLLWSEAYLGMPLVAVGWPAQRSTGEIALQVSRGYLLVDLNQWFRVDLTLYFGNSGGPVFGPDGRLVGLVVSLIKGEDNAAPSEYFVTKAEHVYNLARTLPEAFP